MLRPIYFCKGGQWLYRRRDSQRMPSAIHGTIGEQPAIVDRTEQVKKEAIYAVETG